MRDRGVLEGANDVRQGVYLPQVTDVGGFPQGFLTDGAHVYVLHRSVHQLFGIVESGETVEAVVGNFGNSNMRLTRIGERVLGELGLGQDAEQRTLAHLRQADDAGFHTSF